MPDFKQEIRKRLAALKLSPTRENEIIEELSQHLEDQYEHLLSRGATESDAHEIALMELDETDLLANRLHRVERRVSRRPQEQPRVSSRGRRLRRRRELRRRKQRLPARRLPAGHGRMSRLGRWV